MTETDVLKWIRTNLGEIIRRSIVGTEYTEDLLAAMAWREVWPKIIKYHDMPFVSACEMMKGDYSQREGEVEKQYHGFGFWQIDKKSFPLFCDSGMWKDPSKCCLQAIKVLDQKRNYLRTHLAGLQGDALDRANVAAYNCGEGNVFKALSKGLDIDVYTHEHNYSKEVWRVRSLYKQLI